MATNSEQPQIGNQRCRQCLTKDACIAAKLSSDRLEALPSWLEEGVRCKAGDYLYRAGDVADRQYHIRSGIYKTLVLNSQGDEFITGFHLPGDVLGTVQEAGRHVDSAVALDMGSVCEFVTDKLLRKPDAQLSRALVSHLGESARSVLQHQISLSQSSAQARFAAFCLNYSEKLRRLERCPQFLPTPMSRTDLANYLGMTLESLSRVVSKLCANGVIAASRTQIDIQQPETLKTLALHTTL